MSLTVPETIVEEVRAGRLLPDSTFVRIVHDSLEEAFHIIADLAQRLEAAPALEFAVHAPQHMKDGTRGQLLRLMASHAIRSVVERHFGVRLAFQNCHKVAAFRPNTVDGPAWQKFTSIEAQILNQAPEFLDC